MPHAITSLLIVDDEAAVRTRLTRVARRVLPQALCAEAATLAEARAQLGQVLFSLVLLDVNLPDGSGLELLPWLRTHAPRAEAVVVSSLGDDATVVQAIRGGAVGYLLKIGSDDEMAFSLSTLARGGAPIDPTIARRVLELMSTAPLAAAAPAGEGAAAEGSLTEREREVLQWVARGHSNREIAHELGLSINTVESHAKAIYRKLAVRSRAAAVFNARAQGLLS